MILNDDRSALDAALNENVSICVLIGDEQSVLGSVHKCLEGNWDPQPWYRWFLISNPGLLTSAEISTWFGVGSSNDYVFLGRTTKSVITNGSAGNDLMIQGVCDYLMYVEKFSEADLQ